VGPVPNDVRRGYYVTRKRNRHCVGCSDLLMPDDPRVYCEACRMRQARWQRKHRRRRNRHAKAYRARKKAQLMKGAP